MSNPKSGGFYIQAAPESEAVFVSGTDRKQTPEEKKKVDKILSKKTVDNSAPKEEHEAE
jgi:hypothetical protein